MYYVCVIKSRKDNKLYIGHTDNLKKRILDHNKGNVISTQSRTPFRLLCYEACNILTDAVKREKPLKIGFDRAYLKRRLSDL